MSIRIEVMPFLAASFGVGVVVVAVCRLLRMEWPVAVLAGVVPMIVLGGYMCFFFRDPDRAPPTDGELIVAGADGILARITEVEEPRFQDPRAIRISIFLTLFDVHVNRAPIAGEATFLGYYPGKRLMTFDEKSSEQNQHNAILIEGEHTRCLVKQIVGPVCRRVVYWPDHERAVHLGAGERIGMMKFGSRLDMTFPRDDIVVVADLGARVQAGETVIARLRKEDGT